jgi:hypothetical protein
MQTPVSAVPETVRVINEQGELLKELAVGSEQHLALKESLGIDGSVREVQRLSPISFKVDTSDEWLLTPRGYTFSETDLDQIAQGDVDTRRLVEFDVTTARTPHPESDDDLTMHIDANDPDPVGTVRMVQNNGARVDTGDLTLSVEADPLDPVAAVESLAKVVWAPAQPGSGKGYRNRRQQKADAIEAHNLHYASIANQEQLVKGMAAVQEESKALAEGLLKSEMAWEILETLATTCTQLMLNTRNFVEPLMLNLQTEVLPKLADPVAFQKNYQNLLHDVGAMTNALQLLAAAHVGKTGVPTDADFALIEATSLGYSKVQHQLETAVNPLIYGMIKTMGDAGISELALTLPAQDVAQ